MRITVNDYLKIIHAGIKNGEIKFVNNLISKWIEKYPGDIISRFYLAKLSHLQGDSHKCQTQLKSILLKDPEYLPAIRLKYLISKKSDQKKIASVLHVITGNVDDMDEISPWAVTLRAVRKNRRKQDYKNSERLLKSLYRMEVEQILVALEKMRLSLQNDHPSFSLKIAQEFSSRWPDCIQLRIFRAAAMLKNNLENKAVTLLHSCVSLDPSGEVVKREWGGNHEFCSLWPTPNYIDYELRLPSSIAVPLNWNRLGEGKSAVSKKEHQKSQTLVSEKYPSQVSINTIQGKPIDTYIILTTRSGLEEKYGSKSTEELLKHLEDLRKVISNKEKWEAHIFLPDDPISTRKFSIDPLDIIDPWKIKLALCDLKKELSKKSQTIKAVLIVGGHEIVPFHALSNPTDDSDIHVYSDNPYGSSSGNYLIPEWTIGRLPDENGSDPGLLLAQIRQIIQYHESIKKPRSLIANLFKEILHKLSLKRIILQIFSNPKNFGYSAAVWRRSSLAAFRPIGKGADLRVTPPYDSDTIDVENLLKAKCAYINLHGLSNTPDWYGQRDFSEEPVGPDFPVAISTNSIPNFRNNIDMVFVEACYGGFVINKKIEESMALKLISIGSQGLVGSTCISYGSVFTPLIGADLLAFIFWKYLREGYSFGESLLQAKIGLVKIMNQRQGYLDGEDQKTLMSFVLYGDPLAYLEPNTNLDVLSKAYDTNSIEYTTVADQEGIISGISNRQTAVSKEINEIIQSYIPSLDNANIKIREYTVGIQKLMGEQKSPDQSGSIRKYTQIQYSQKSLSARNTHEQYARVTIDDQGKITKLAVSR